MTWIIPSVITALAGATVLLGVFVFLFRLDRERHMAFWAWGWFFYGLHYLVLLLSLTLWPSVEMKHFSHLSVLGQSFLLFLGTSAFLGKTTKPIWLVSFATGIAWVFWSHLADLPSLAANVPVSLFHGLIGIWTGLLLLRAAETDRGGRLVTGWGFILWGLNNLEYPFMPHVERVAAWEYLLDAILSFIVALGMLLIYFQRMRRDLLAGTQALQQSETRFRAIFDQTFQFCGLLQPDGTLLEVNQTALAISGVGAEQVVGAPLWQAPWWGNSPTQQQTIQTAVNLAAAGEFVRLETSHQVDGHIRQIDFSLKPVRHASGEIIHLLAEGRDITALKDNEARLRATLLTSEALLRASPSAIFALDLDNLVTAWNPAAEKIFGWRREEILGRPYPLVPKGGEERHFWLWQQLHQGLEVKNLLLQRQGKDGTQVDVNISLAPLYDGDNRFCGCMAVFEDYRDRLRLETELRQSEQRFRALVEQAADALFVHDFNGRFLDVNPQACRSLGYSREELLQLRVQDIDATLPVAEAPRLWEGLKSGEAVTLERTHRRKTGVEFPVEVRIGRLEGLQGGPWVLAMARNISDRKAVENRLRYTLEKLEALFLASPSPICVLDLADQVIEWNPAAERVFGWRREEVLGRPYPLVTEGRGGDFKATKQAILSGAQLSRQDSVRRAKDGSLIEVSISVAPLCDEQKQLVGYMAVFEDIRERNAVLKKLQEQKNLLSNILSTIPYSVFWKDRNSDYLGCNVDFARNAGLERPEAIDGKSDFDLTWSQKDAEFFRQCDAEIMARGEPMLDFEETQLQADGSERTLLISKVPLRDPSGEIIGLLGMFSDITAHKAADDALRQSEQQFKQLSQEFQALLDGIPDILLLFSPTLEVIWANKHTEEHFKLDRKTLPGQSCQHLWEVHGAPCDPCLVVDCFSWGNAEETKVETANERIWGVKTFPIKDGSGNVVKVIFWATEISEKIRLREEAMRSSRLASLGELAAGMAHEINNPNGLILLNLPMLSDSCADAWPVLEAHFRQHPEFTLGGLSFPRMRLEIPETLGEIQEAARRIKRIVEDLKNFARQESLEQAEQFDLNNVTQAAVRLIGNALRQSTDRFSTLFAEKLPPVCGNFQRIEQVVLNLLMNAYQALPSKEKGIFLETRFDEQVGMCIVEIHDEGVGIAPENLPNLTNPFFTTRRQQGGTGLGLSISARIVKDHRGRLEFASTLGAGTVVTLYLPVQPEEPC